MSKKNQVSWVKPTEPSFLRKFKNDIGYKEGPTIDTKRQEVPAVADDSGDSDREDERPQVVVLKTGDLTAEEVMKVKGELKGEAEGDAPADGKIVFRKPVKRSSGTFQGITASSSKKKKEVEKKRENPQRKVKNSSLLSFGEDEEED
ncbi:uncharacterized protein KIAA1143 homolog [Lepisosteus oculatus]|nr:PREDICTED: uncharacterized protein KIAA1143 homolog [Lepisosteus oculatus]